ncbi:P27 family phage terminase small subunit [Oceanibium sediminis]|uniref:P27 family phage terminase small subunit n=1 Tax=Oceanibium sediminis TaxID=2026339 RepID=UPI001E52513A|nr:P27 family phage terminase small subunit [Oceanibium sediminis]
MSLQAKGRKPFARRDGNAPKSPRALAAYRQCYGRWVEAEQKLKATPTILKTPSGYVQQSFRLSISNKQPELMGRYMAEPGLSPSACQRLALGPEHGGIAEPLRSSS